MKFFMDRIMNRSICYFGGGGGGTQSTNTVYQETELSKAQAEILKSLGPYIANYGVATIPQMQGLTEQQLGFMKNIMTEAQPGAMAGVQTQNLQAQNMLGLTNYLAPQLMQQAQGQATGQQMMNLNNTQNMIRRNMASMGVGAGDPRLTQQLNLGTENLTKGNAGDAVSALMQLFGTGAGLGALGTATGTSQGTTPNAMQPTSLLSMMGANPVGGSKSTSKIEGIDTTGQDVMQGIGTAAMIAMVIASLV